jgi:hypothetical protein
VVTSTGSQRDSRNSLLAEITGYLGGAFILISLAVFVGERFDSLDKVLRSGLFALLSGALALLTLWLGTYSSLRARLSSVLGLGSSVSMTVALATYFEIDRAPLAAFLIGTALTAAFFFKNRTELLHLGTAIYLFITSIMLAATIVIQDRDALTMPAAASIWLGLSAIWIYLAFNRKIQVTLGYALASLLLFLAIQVFFIQDHRPISYLVAAVSVYALMRLYLIERIWPLLVAPLLIANFSIAELISATLGGSLGAVTGLFVAGVLLIVTSLYVTRSLNQPKRS